MKTIVFFALICYSICTSQTIALQSFATGFASPVEITHAGDNRLFVVEKGGTIRILNPDGSVESTPFLSITSQVSTGGEQGLLGLAFHPNYESTGLFYINYTDTNGDTVIKQYNVMSANPSAANPASGKVILTIDQPYENHNGGSLKFGPDGYLYIGMGDGGSGGDQENRAQNINELLGKMLRIDINSCSCSNDNNPYKIPANNPYVDKDGADEIWAIGLRNPWKFSFDKVKGNLWIADVGQGTIEEVNVVPATQSGINYGWPCFEGNDSFKNTGCPAQSSLKFPLTTLNHNTNVCSVTGGYVYNGTKYPNFKGLYFYSDYCKPQIWTVNAAGEVTPSDIFSGNNFSTFGEDKSGELYIGSLNNGTIYKITDSSLSRGQSGKSRFIIYPNPTKSEIYIQKPSDDYPEEATIFDLNGRQLLQQTGEDKQTNTIKTGILSSGIYLITLKSSQGSYYTQRLVIE